MEVEANCSFCGEMIDECAVCGSEFEPEEDLICIRIKDRLERTQYGVLIRILQEYRKKAPIPESLHICQNCANEAEPEIS
jgi:hypothetical protein